MFVFILCCVSPPAILLAARYEASPSDYRTYLPKLRPGDFLYLQPGIYDDPSEPPGLPFFNIHGTADAPIVIEGPTTGPPAILMGRASHNTIRFDDASYLTIRHLEINGRNRGGDGVKAQGVAHHIVLEDLYIHGVGPGVQNVVGIGTTGGTTWNWVIRRCRIENAGTGMYLGGPYGDRPFIAGVIEHNLVTNSMGYNLQIKHQKYRPSLPGMPTDARTTIIRHNVFQKGGSSSTGKLARPNVLVGHFPLHGPGHEDRYEIYGNVFSHNPSNEGLFQGEGHIALYHNVFFNPLGNGIIIKPHNDVPREIHVFRNTVVAKDWGIWLDGGESKFRQHVVSNLVFAGRPIWADNQTQNFSGAFASAAIFLTKPFGKLGEWDLYPRQNLEAKFEVGNIAGPTSFTEVHMDFNGHPVSDRTMGAYAGWGKNPGWLPRHARKPKTFPTDDVLTSSLLE